MHEVSLVINPNARSGEKKHLRKRAEELLKYKKINICQQLILDKKNNYHNQLELFIQQSISLGCKKFVAAGGDGTVNLVLQILLKQTKEKNFEKGTLYLGAIGLGSSNDYHKPKKKIDSAIQYKLNFQQCTQQDLIKVKSGNNVFYALNNFSIGFTANANDRFNKCNYFIKFWKKIHSDLGIFATILLEIIFIKKNQISVFCDGKKIGSGFLCNLGVIKNRHVAGMFRYPKIVSRSDSKLGVFAIDQTSRLNFLSILAKMIFGKFQNNAICTKLTAKNIKLTSESLFNYEIDGEVIESHNLEITAEKSSINLAS